MKSKGAIILAVPLVFVNGVAFTGQLAFLRTHLSWPVIGDVMFAVSLESVAIFLAYMAHAALIGNDSSTRLRLASYAFGIAIGLMNASHYMHNGRLTFAAIGLGLMSASSPFLWSVWSRRQSRDALIANDLIEGHAVRLGVNRWLWHPRKSFTVFRAATWEGEQNPIRAIETYSPVTVTAEIVPDMVIDSPDDAPTVSLPLPDDAPDDAPGMAIDGSVSNAQAVRIAIGALGDASPAPTVSAWLQARGRTVSPAYVRQVKSLDRRRTAVAMRSTVHALPAPETGTKQAKS